MMNHTQQSQTGAANGSTQESAGLGAIDPKEVVSMVEGFVRENPRVALLGAVAAGFLLGGGLTPRLLSTVAVIAGRNYLNHTVRNTMQSVLREKLGGGPLV
jgi:hypothetical protein